MTIVAHDNLPTIAQCDVKNKMGQNFFKIFFYDGSVSICAYKCKECNTIFMSKTSFHQHHHVHDEKFHYDEIRSTNAFIILLAVCDIPIRAMTSPAFEEFCHSISPYFQVPGRNKTRKLIAEYATQIHNNNMQKIYGDFCYILIDGANKFHKKLEGILIVTYSYMFFWKFEEVMHATGKALSDIISTVIHDLKINHNRLIAIVTDNASNNVLAFNPEHGLCQEGSKEYFIHFRCICHSLDLALKHTFNMIQNAHWLESLKNLLSFLSHTTGVAGPSISIRWSSITDCAKFVLIHLDDIKNNIEREKKHRRNVKKVCDALNDFKDFSISQFYEVLNHFTNFLNTFQGNHDRIDEFWDSFIDFHHNIQPFMAYSFTRDLFQNILLQIQSKQVLGITLLAYSFVETGYQVIVYSPFFSSIQRTMIQTLQQYLIDTHQDQNSPMIIREYIAYLKPATHNFQSSYEHWEAIFLSQTQIHLAQIAVQILGIPTSEAAVERLFAHLSSMFRCCPDNMNLDLINERMTIKCQYYLNEQANERKSSIEERMNHVSARSFYKELH